MRCRAQRIARRCSAAPTIFISPQRSWLNAAAPRAADSKSNTGSDAKRAMGGKPLTALHVAFGADGDRDAGALQETHVRRAEHAPCATALSAGVSNPRFHRRSIGRTPCAATHCSISRVDRCRSIMMPASSSSASVARRAKVASLSVFAAERCEGGRNQRVALVAGRAARARASMIARHPSPRACAVGDRHADHRAHALLARRASRFLGKIIAIAETGDAGLEHFGDGRQGAVAREFGSTALRAAPPCRSRRETRAWRRSDCTLIMPGIRRCEFRCQHRRG